MGKRIEIHKKALWLLVLWSGILSVAVYFATKVILDRFLCEYGFVAFRVAVALAAVFLLLSFVEYKSFSATLIKNKIEVRRGILIKRHQRLYVNGAVSVKTVKTPLMKMFKLRAVVVIFEGSFYPLPPLREEDTEFIIEHIKGAKEK